MEAKMLAHVYNTRIQEAETRKSRVQGPVWAAQDPMSKKKKKMFFQIF